MLIEIVDNKIRLYRDCKCMYIPLPSRNFGFIYDLKNKKIINKGEGKMVQEYFDRYKEKMNDNFKIHIFDVLDEMVLELNLFMKNNNLYKSFVNKYLEKTNE